MRPILVLVMLVLAASMLPQGSARADMAPPMTPPGSTLLPGGESTRVRMLAEVVTLTVVKDPADPEGTIANTEATFTMRNLGPSEERMQARFPLSFPNGGNDGYFNYPEIPSISVTVDGRSVPTRREMQPPFNPETYGTVREEVPWAVFDVTFPPETDVQVDVSYSYKGYGYYPQATFDYVLETGAGWNGTIGSADIIVDLPYDASDLNVLLDQTAPRDASKAPQFTKGTQLGWHYDDLEPTSSDNVQVTILAPALWQTVLKETVAVSTNPKDGEAWGRLAKAYKESARGPKGWLREDAGGRTLVDLSMDAYQECLELLPKDALWHYGYADLLWSTYYRDVRFSGNADTEGLLPRTLSELQAALALDPDNPQGIDLLNWIESDVPGSVAIDGTSYTFLALTATPLPPTPYELLETATPPSAPAETPMPQPTTDLATSVPSPQPYARNPICGALTTVLVPILVLVGRRRRRL
jgi:hypothetical protein